MTTPTTPATLAAYLEREPDPTARLRALAAFFADSYQWTAQTDGTVRWGWFESSPAALARAALGESPQPAAQAGPA